MSETELRGAPPAASVAMLLADGRLPVGGHANSAGLEPALLGGMPDRHILGYLIARVHTVARIEAGAAVVARRHALEARPDLAAQLARVERAWAARTPSGALRDTSRALGRGYSRLAGRIWPENAGVAAVRSAPVPLSRGVILGAVAAAAGIPATDLARLVVYDDAQAVAAAVLKLRPIDPAVPAAWVLHAAAEAEGWIASIAELTTADAIPASGAPQSEGWAEAHSLLNRRLFHA